MNKKNIKNWYLYQISDEHLSEFVSLYNNIIRYKTGFTGDTAIYLECGNINYLLVDGRFSIQARNEVDNKKIKVVDLLYKNAFFDFLKELLLKEKGGVELSIDYKRFSTDKILEIQKTIFEVNLEIAKTEFEKLEKNIENIDDIELLIKKEKLQVFLWDTEEFVNNNNFNNLISIYKTYQKLYGISSEDIDFNNENGENNNRNIDNFTNKNNLRNINIESSNDDLSILDSKEDVWSYNSYGLTFNNEKNDLLNDYMFNFDYYLNLLNNKIRNELLDISNNFCFISFHDTLSDENYKEYRKNLFHLTNAPLFLLDNSPIKIFDKNLVDLLLDDAAIYIASSKIEIAYLTNLRYEFCDVDNMGVLFDSFLIISKNKKYLYIHDYVNEEVEDLFLKHNVFIRRYDDFYHDLTKLQTIFELNTDYKINFDSSINNFYILMLIASALKEDVIHSKSKSYEYRFYISYEHINFIDSSLENLMSIRTNDEIKNMKKVNVIDGVAITECIYVIKKNRNKIFDYLKLKGIKKNKLNEFDIQNYVDDKRRENKNFLCTSFDTIVAFGSNAAICHYSPTKEKSKVINDNNVLLIDSGGHYKIGTTDITRTISLYKNKKEIPKDLKIHFTLVLRAMLNLQNLVFLKGYKGKEVDLVARSGLYEYGLDFNHGTGHGIGYVTSVHSGPNAISPKCDDKNDKNILEINQVQSIEPGLYFDKKYGIRIENDVYVDFYKKTNFGEFLHFVPLTLCPIDKDLIDEKMLNEKEKMYLNNYHKEVFDKLSPYFKNEKLKWLKEMCSPLK